MRPQTETYLRADIENTLRAISQVNSALVNGLPVREVLIYNAGFRAAIAACATAFGVDLPLVPASDQTSSPILLLET